MTYKEQLLDQRWKDKRDIIIDRDRMCFKCGLTKGLQVHHTKYIDGLMAWEYPDRLLITLCSGCHGLEHGLLNGRLIPEVRVIGDIIISRYGKG